MALAAFAQPPFAIGHRPLAAPRRGPLGSGRRFGFLAQFLEAGADRGKIIGGAGLGHIPS